MKKFNRSILKSFGVNQSEAYLAKLCNQTFLSLWSYPNLYHRRGEELCDLLVAFGEHILIFSDKNCGYPTTQNSKLNWSRWFRRAIKESADQLWRAESWIRKNPEQIFLDKACAQKFPLRINLVGAKIHLIAVARGSSRVSASLFGGSGSLMIQNNIKGVNAHTQPFIVGDLNPSKTFIHILDDITLDILMGELDTIYDFTSYLSKKELLLRSEKKILAAGEEELLPNYMTNMKDGGHDFNFPDHFNGISIPEGEWNSFCKHPQRMAQQEEDKISYLWDHLIEQFNAHALAGTQYIGNIQDSERVMRCFASESRFMRRVLSKALLGLLEKTPRNIIGRRFSIPLNGKSPFYVFVAFPHMNEHSEEEYRSLRREYLSTCCMIVRSVYPSAEDIIGFATESGTPPKSSEDAIYFDGRIWSEALQKDARDAQTRLKILTNPTAFETNDSEFPDRPHTHTGLSPNYPKSKPDAVRRGDIG